MPGRIFIPHLFRRRPIKALLGLTAILAISLPGAPALASTAQDAGASKTPLNISVRRIGIPDADQAAETAPARGPDLQPVWDAVSRQDWATAQSRLDATRQFWPDWTPPENLTDLIDAEQRRVSIQNAFDAEDWTRVLTLTRHDCADDAGLWMHSVALHNLGRQADLRAFHIQTLTQCQSLDTQRRMLERAATQLDEDGLFAVARAPLGPHTQAALQPSLSHLLATANALKFDRLIAAEDWSNAVLTALQMNDRNRLVQSGWGVLDANPALAVTAFKGAIALSANNATRDEESHFGYAAASVRNGDDTLALAYIPDPSGARSSFAAQWEDLSASAHLRVAENARKSGDWANVIKAADKARRLGDRHKPAADALSGGALLDAAQTAYDNADFQTARQLGEQAARYEVSARAGQMRAAWSNLQLAQTEAAQATFLALYQAKPDQESAQGLVLASSKAHKIDALGPLADQMGGPLKKTLNTHQSDIARAQHKDTLALALAPNRHPELAGAASFWVRQSIAGRRTSGDAGLGRMEGVITRTSAGFSSGRLNVESGFVATSVDAGNASAAAFVGQPGSANASGKLDAVAPFLKIEREGPTTLALQLATSPMGGAVDESLLGEVSLTTDAFNGATAGGLFARARDDTLTSLSGREIPGSDVAWGRVVETGAEISDRHRLNDTLSVAANAAISRLEGQNTLDNTRVRGQIGLAADIAPEGFDYLSTGPFYAYDSYEKNTNYHTLGHGGYYSPQESHRVGWSVNLQTKDARDWMVRADAAAAYETASTDDAAILPLSAPDGPAFEGTDTSGLAFAAEFRAARRVSEKWIATLDASVLSSDAHEDARIGVSLRFTPGGRASVLNRDLGPDPFNRDIW